MWSTCGRRGRRARALIDNPADRQAAGSVPADTGIVPRVSIGGGATEPLWRADAVSQRYLPGTNVVRTVARFGRVGVEITAGAAGRVLAETVAVRPPDGARAVPRIGVDLEAGRGVGCRQRVGVGGVTLVCSAAASRPAAANGEARGVLRDAAAGDRRWIARARPLGSGGAAMGAADVPALAADPAGPHRPAHGGSGGWGPGRLGLRLAPGCRHRRARLRRGRLPTRGAPDRALPARARPQRRRPLLRRRITGPGTSGPGRRRRLGRASPPEQRASPSHTDPLPWRNRPDYQEGDPGTTSPTPSPLHGSTGLKPPYMEGNRPVGGERPGLRRRSRSRAAWCDRPATLALGSTPRRPGRCGRFRSRRSSLRSAGPCST